MVNACPGRIRFGSVPTTSTLARYIAFQAPVISAPVGGISRCSRMCRAIPHKVSPATTVYVESVLLAEIIPDTGFRAATPAGVA